MTKPNFNTITGRCFGLTPDQWDAEAERLGLTDEQLYDILRVKQQTTVHNFRARRFFNSGKLGAPDLTNN